MQRKISAPAFSIGKNARMSCRQIHLEAWLEAGKIKPCTAILQGLENLPRALLGLFSGDNLGKQLVQVN